MQQIYRVIANKFSIKINNNNNIIIINNNFIVTKTKQLKIKKLKNCLYFVNINIKSFALNINKVIFKKNINKYIVFIQYLIIVYILEIKYICLYIKD